MRGKKASKGLSSIDYSNNSFTDIIGSPSERYCCKICKETDTSQYLMEFCICDNLVHE